MVKENKSILKRLKKSVTFHFLTFAFITVIGYAVFYIYPIFRTLMLSFTDARMGHFETNIIGFTNYTKIFQSDPFFFKALGNTFFLALGTGAVTLIVSLFTALLLNSKVKGVGIFRVIFFLPFIIPAFASAAIFKGLFDPNVGIINLFLRTVGVVNPPGWFLDEKTALTTMIIMSVWGFGVQMLIFLAALQNVPAELYEAADIDGAKTARKFFSVTIPMIAPMLFLNVVLVTINGMKGFATSYLIGGLFGTPNGSTLVVPVLIFRDAFTTVGGYRMGYASAMSWIFFIILLTLTLGQFLLSKLYVKKDIV